jgi:hypothetical protein
MFFPAIFIDFGEELQLQVLIGVNVGDIYITLPTIALQELKVFRGSTGIWESYKPSNQEVSDFMTVNAQGIQFYLNVNDSNNAIKTITYQVSTYTFNVVRLLDVKLRFENYGFDEVKVPVSLKKKNLSNFICNTDTMKIIHF